MLRPAPPVPVSLCSLDGKRLYVTTSLFSPWDAQFYPGLKDKVGFRAGGRYTTAARRTTRSQPLRARSLRAGWVAQQVFWLSR